MNAGLIETLSMTLLITSVAAVELRRLSFSAVAYSVQATIIVLLLICFGAVNSALYAWAATALFTKAVAIPWLLFRAIPSTTEREGKPVIGFGLSVVLAVLVMAGFFRLTHGHAGLLMPAGQQEVFRTNLAVAATVFVLGLFCVLTRRDAIKAVVGLCLLENGVHLSLVSLAPGLPETALFGIASEVVVTVWLLLYVIHGVKQEFGSTDTFELRELRW